MLPASGPHVRQMPASDAHQARRLATLSSDAVKFGAALSLSHRRRCTCVLARDTVRTGARATVLNGIRRGLHTAAQTMGRRWKRESKRA